MYANQRSAGCNVTSYLWEKAFSSSPTMFTSFTAFCNVSLLCWRIVFTVPSRLFITRAPLRSLNSLQSTDTSWFNWFEPTTTGVESRWGGGEESIFSSFPLEHFVDLVVCCAFNLAMSWLNSVYKLLSLKIIIQTLTLRWRDGQSHSILLILLCFLSMKCE